ncbi:MAG: mandelate racemase, partial [Candidatus Solibacter usitatus]|nr:mandelate racemase [Candidatus Solibacter usitatus]
MQRRNFLTTLASLPALAAPVKPQKIAAVELSRLSGRRTVTSGQDNQHQVQANHIYAELRPKPYRDNPQPARESATSALYLTIRTDSGLEGVYGPVDREAALVIETQIKGFLTGKDALAVETLWDQMYRSNRHARSSLFMMAISAIDNCLWDLRGRFFQTP